MERHELPYKKIIFVCTNQREPGERPCCAGRGGNALRDQLKDMVKERQLQGRIRVSQSGCLNCCADGPNIMVFPDGVWYSHAQPEDLETILNAVVASL